MPMWKSSTEGKSQDEQELVKMNENERVRVAEEKEFWTSIVQYVIGDDASAETAISVADKILAARRERFPSV
jgi:hypothetical protein